MPTTPLFLRRLARSHGVQTSYFDLIGSRVEVSVEAILAVLNALGCNLRNPDHAREAWRERRQTLWRRVLEPVSVAWTDGPGSLKLRLPASLADSDLSCEVILESGERRSWVYVGASSAVLARKDVEGTAYAVKRLPLPNPLPWGYHALHLHIGEIRHQSLVISSPIGAYLPSDEREANAGKKSWGVFLPLYALRSQRGWGAGDFSDLERLIRWVGGLGGGGVATLPLLAAFLDEPLEPSPYVPVSRLFWNEFYLDPTRTSEFADSTKARELWEGIGRDKEAESLRSNPLVDYRPMMRTKRKILEELAGEFFARQTEGNSDFSEFLRSHPDAEDYAKFRACCESRQAVWREWPSRMRDGFLQEGDYDESARRYHLYAQWIAHRQLGELSQSARQSGWGLYLDLALGVHPDGYDVWREQDLFARDVSAGAPLDDFFTKGQNWGFPPIVPEKLREQGHRHFIACIRNHLRHAGILRLDHIMGLHRLFWIPKGMDAKNGVYVRYPAKELYAILALESHRAKSLIVGEDLGTVPSYVRSAMSRHRIQRTYVGQFEVRSDPHWAIQPPPENCAAGLNTHDLPPFAAFCRGLDIDDRVALGLLDEATANHEKNVRGGLVHALREFLGNGGWFQGENRDDSALLRAFLAYLGASPARIVLVNLEDLWGETLPQNTPGTGSERPNWRRTARYGFEEFSQMPEVLSALQRVAEFRRK